MLLKHRYLALDYGIKRVGLAISHMDMTLVLPLCTLDRSIKVNFYSDLEKVLADHKPTAFVLGLPLHQDGSPSPNTPQIRNFAKSLARRYPLPIYFMEELLSSHEAEEKLRSVGLSSKKIKEVIDQQAAVQILTSFLECPKKILADSQPIQESLL